MRDSGPFNGDIGGTASAISSIPFPFARMEGGAGGGSQFGVEFWNSRSL